MKSHAYLDSNVVIDFCWDIRFGENKHSRKNVYKLFEMGAGGDFEGYVSTFTFIEINLHFTEYYFLQKHISEGFGFRELSRERRKYRLKEEEKKEIKEMIKWLRNDMGLNIIDVKEITASSLKYVQKYIDNGMGFIDALHLQVALETGCNYLVTKDGDFRKRTQDLVSNNQLIEDIKPITISGFLKKIKNK